ncbi:hypothetical protein GCM10010140_29570 [Streptosporangium pseudovulgare]|uniref:Uncharacterized protein n=1 Tax=Streptosporangium pseudovulgare TaxID=35765 RepID=A0ABQ2QXP8_9ACTN|nr:hypothetical protein GCM10010140_29570 [Streptosporangium pseudovulgare]
MVHTAYGSLQASGTVRSPERPRIRPRIRHPYPPPVIRLPVSGRPSPRPAGRLRAQADRSCASGRPFPLVRAGRRPAQPIFGQRVPSRGTFRSIR